MNKLPIFFFAAAGFLVAAETRADVTVTMHNGLVSIVAKDATVRQILAEWARVGRTKIVNAERIAGGPVSLELSEIPEKQALDILLRSVNGYLAAPRPNPDATASAFDRILVLPTSTPPRSLSASSSIPAPLPQPRFQLPPAPQEPDDQAGPLSPTPMPGDPSQRQPIVNQFPPPMPAAAPDTVRGAPAFGPPGAPVGTSAPGMVVQPPTQTQPGPPGRF